MKQNPKRKKKLEEENKVQDEMDFTLRFVTYMKLNLDLAGILYVNAHLQIKQGQKEFLKLQKEIEKYKAFYKKRAAKYPIESEDFITYQLHKLRDIEVFYEPVVRHFSTAKMLLVCCAETYVNEIAAVTLNGKTLDEFDKLSIIGKWIFIQELTKVKKKLTLDKNPMQGFVELTKERNKLVHFKGMKKDLQLLEIPNYLDELKLTPKDCLKNVQSITDLIRNFSLQWKGSYGPGWLNFEEEDYRNPCFYLGNREVASVLYSDRYDKERF